MKTYQQMMDFVLDIPSNYHDHTFEMIHKYVSQIQGKLVEFGTGLGKCTVAMHFVNPKLEIFTFDIGERYGTHEEYKQRIKNAFKNHKVKKNVHFQIGSSLEVPLIDNLDGLFIDSEHTYDVTKAEIERWVPMVKKGGLIMFDDYGLRDSGYSRKDMWGVAQSVDELLLPQPDKYELLEKGMACVFKKL